MPVTSLMIRTLGTTSMADCQSLRPQAFRSAANARQRKKSDIAYCRDQAGELPGCRRVHRPVLPNTTHMEDQRA